ncbi:MAG: Mini-ribonuclease 3 [Coleofasciculus sp. Co-bin14]|nr:Mini-ribonuclease 3 [Coleofasciculus sp. Co-bin14]
MTSEEEESSNILKADSALSWAEARFKQLSAVAESNLQIQQVSPASLAYLGDAVYELYIRTRHLLPAKRISDYHHQVVSQVRAESQANHLRSLEPHLTAPELDILRRGRNAVTGSPRRLDPKIYQQATSLETLIGYLFLTNPQRLTQLLAYLDLDPD